MGKGLHLALGHKEKATPPALSLGSHAPTMTLHSQASKQGHDPNWPNGTKTKRCTAAKENIVGDKRGHGQGQGRRRGEIQTRGMRQG